MPYEPVGHEAAIGETNHAGALGIYPAGLHGRIQSRHQIRGIAFPQWPILQAANSSP